ncbi:MAG: glycosyltransferase [Brachymonas sp.]
MPNTTRVVLLGVDTQRFSPPPSKAQAWAATGLPGRYGIGIFGRVRHQKGIHIFVQALLQVLPQFPDFTAVVCGLCKPEDEDYRAQLQQHLAEAGLQERVVWLGTKAAAPSTFAITNSMRLMSQRGNQEWRRLADEVKHRCTGNLSTSRSTMPKSISWSRRTCQMILRPSARRLSEAQMACHKLNF